MRKKSVNLSTQRDSVLSLLSKGGIIISAEVKVKMPKGVVATVDGYGEVTKTNEK